jgi:membrane glycosyltransferase
MDGVNARPSDGFAALPQDSPMAMPAQSLRQRGFARRRGPRFIAGLFLCRCFVFGGAVAMTGAAAYQMHRVLSGGSVTVLEVVLLTLFVSLFAWIALSFFSAVAGFVSLVSRGGRPLGILDDCDPASLHARTALLVPTYNEDPSRIAAAIQAMHAALAATSAGERFDFFIISDTTDPNVWIAEDAAFLALRASVAGNPGIYYRRRPRNTARKSGNVAEWVGRFGGAYPQMIVLDADSIMTADATLRLAAAMERHPDVGLIQTVPMIVNATTLFARLQQFAGALYGPLVAHGVASWHGPDGNYWGHNAVIRTAAFAEHAGLPELRGRKPFGGHIMSHDFVEAALLRRAGWAVWMVPALVGSYEEGPPNVTDMLVRDRRWCQGNLQHLAVITARGLHSLSRLHMLVGVGSYITAPLWLLFLLTGILVSVQSRFIRPEYFPTGGSLFPHWPVIDPIRAKWLFIGTMGVLLLPKLLGFLAMLFDRRRRRGFGGAVRALLGMLLETLLTGLLAPVMMLSQSSAVVGILAGRDGGWQTQRRDDGGIPLRETARLYARHSVFGLALGAVAYLVSPPLALWMLPVLGGLVLAIPLAALTGSGGAGRAMRRIGLLTTPEERAPPDILVATRAQRAAFGEATDVDLARLLTDPALLDAHRRMLPPPRVRGRDPIDPALVLGLARVADADRLDQAVDSLEPRELLALMGNAEGLDRLAALAAAESTPPRRPAPRTAAAGAASAAMPASYSDPTGVRAASARPT